MECPGGSLKTQCQKCRLHVGKEFVPPIGDLVTRKIILVGEGPGDKENIKRRPFVGPAGQCLQSGLSDLGLCTGDLYVTNVVKHQPPGNRKPTVDEIRACVESFLSKELQGFTGPIVCLGRTAAETVAAHYNISIPQSRWRGVTIGNVTFTWHPSYVIRNGDYSVEGSTANKLYCEMKTDILKAWSNR